MDLLIVESLTVEVLHWLDERYRIRYRPELAVDRRAFLRALREVDAVMVPPGVAVDLNALERAPMLRAVGRVGDGFDNIDLDACIAAGIEVVRSPIATSMADASFMVDTLQSMRRASHRSESAGAGRELDSLTVGLVGTTLAGRHAARLLSERGATVFAYEPSLHASSALWREWQIEALALAPLLERADALCVQMPALSRYRGLFGDRWLSMCKPGQLLVSLSHSILFREAALAEALASERLAGAWFDSFEADLLAAGRPLHRVAPLLRITPPHEARLRREWAVARCLHDVLEASELSAPMRFRSTLPSAPPVP